MSRRPQTLPVSEVPRSRTLGLLVAGGAVALTTAVLYPLRDVAPAASTALVCLLDLAARRPHDG